MKLQRTLTGAEAEESMLESSGLRSSKVFTYLWILFRKTGNLCDYPHRNGPARSANCCSILQG